MTDSRDFTQTGSDPNRLLPAIREHGKRSSQVMTGLVLIVVGAIFLADRVGWQWGWHVSFGRLWPLILIAVGLGTMFSHRDGDIVTERDADGRVIQTTKPRGRHKLGDGIPVLLTGIIMLLHTNNWLRLSQSWPLFVVAAGLSLVFSRSCKPGREGR